MDIGIIGAGFTGLSAAIYLASLGHQVTIFESLARPGGLAVGFKDPEWDWPLEKHYHHLFSSDWAIRRLAGRASHPISFTRPATSTFINGQINQLDSPASLLKFPHLSPGGILRTAAALAYLRLTPFWRPLEKLTAEKFILSTMGSQSWTVVWEPLFKGKFHHFYHQIPASWFWARIKKRSSSLGYPQGGFESLARACADLAERNGAKFNYATGVTGVSRVKGHLALVTDTKQTFTFAKVICTLPAPLFVRITPGLDPSFVTRLSRLRGIGAVNLVLALKKPFLKDVYWLNINDLKLPFLAVVEHTNFIDPSHYGGDHLVYVGNYLPAEHQFFSATSAGLINRFTSGLRQINPQFSPRWIRRAWVWKAPFAQPIVTLNYSQLIPPFSTPVTNLFLANIQQVYPWDRGTNYAVELGLAVARHALKT